MLAATTMSVIGGADPSRPSAAWPPADRSLALSLTDWLLQSGLRSAGGHAALGREGAAPRNHGHGRQGGRDEPGGGPHIQVRPVKICLDILFHPISMVYKGHHDNLVLSTLRTQTDLQENSWVPISQNFNTIT